MLCELYKNQLITFRLNRTSTYKPIYYAPIKQVYTTFNEKYIEVFYDGKWLPAKIIGIASEKEIYQINKNLFCSGDLILKTPYGDKKVSELNVNDEYSSNHKKSDKITAYHGPTYISKIEKTDIVSDWLFGIEFKNPEDQYYTLTDGYIIAVK